MKFEIERAALQATLGRLKSVAPQRNTIPVIGHVLISASGGRAEFSATDCDMLLVETLPARVEVAGDATAPVPEFSEIARRLPTDNVSIETENRRVVIRGGRARLWLEGLASEGFPKFKADRLPCHFDIEATELGRLIGDVAFCASTEEARPYLNGVYFHVAGAALRAVGCDGNRLARAETGLPDGAAGMPGVIVPNKTAALLQALLKGFNGGVSVAISAAKIMLSIGGAVLTSKLIDGHYPDYERVIPAVNDRVVEVDGAALAEAVELVRIVAEKQSRIVVLDVGDHSLTVSAFVDMGGAAGHQGIDAAIYGEPIRTAFNGGYLCEVARHAGRNLRLQLAGPEHAALIRDPDSSTLFVVMSCRA
jgi:DNA polymerase-3 subunit beta